MQTSVTIVRIDGDEYRIRVTDDDSSTHHRVKVTAADVEALAPGADPAQLVVASFRFLLEREPKESILRSFDLPVIERYFPEYPTAIRRHLG